MTVEETVIKFYDFINSCNIGGLSSMMTDDHAFIDTLNSEIKGKENCVIACEGFFEAFPDYKNYFTKLAYKDNFVMIEGYSTCSVKILDGPALWTAKVNGNKISEWRVYEQNE